MCKRGSVTGRWISWRFGCARGARVGCGPGGWRGRRWSLDLRVGDEQALILARKGTGGSNCDICGKFTQAERSGQLHFTMSRSGGTTLRFFEIRTST